MQEWVTGCLCIAVNCFNAVMTEGLPGLGLPLPPSVRVHRDPRARHQALREHLRDMALETASRTEDADDCRILDDTLESLQDGRLIQDDASLFIVEMLSNRVSINFIDGDALLGALQVTSYAGGQSWISANALNLETCRFA